MSEESSGEKVFDPTPQKLAEARRKGDVAKSTDVSTAATYLALLAVFVTVGAFAVDQAASVLMVVPVLVFFLFTQRWIVAGLTLTGGK